MVTPCRFQQDEGADDVGLHEVGGPVDRAVDMAFRRQMHDEIGPEARKRGFCRRKVADIRAQEGVAAVFRNGIERAKVPRVGQLVEVDDRLIVASQPVEDFWIIFRRKV